MKRIITLLSIIAILFVNIEPAIAEEEKVTVESTVAYPEAPEINGYAAILIDMDTGAILYAKNAHEKLYPASITKIMTGLLAVENCALEDSFTFTQEIINALPWDAAKYGYVPGETVNIRDLLYVLMLRSANEVAIGLGMKIAGTEEAFGKLMTERAKEIGAVNTNFVNATGLHDDNHYTTAYDMALISIEAMKNSTFMDVWGTPSYTVNPTNVQPDIVRIWNRHDMLVNRGMQYYAYAKGGKTGYTDEAGKTLVTYASRDGRNLMCVVMKSGAETVFSDTRLLFEYGFGDFENISIKGNESRFGQSNDSYFVSRDHLYGSELNLMELDDGYVTVPKGTSLQNIGYELTYVEQTEDGIIANIEYKIGDNSLGKTSLRLNVNKEESSEASPYREEEEQDIQKQKEFPINIYVVGGILASILVLFLVIKILRKTSGKRKVKRARKKLFKNNRLH